MAAKRPHNDALTKLRGLEVHAKQADREAEHAALTARNEVEQAEQQVIRAHAGHGELRSAERALATAETEVRDKTLRA